MVNNSSMVNRGKGSSDGIPTSDAFDGSCAGLTPVLEAVDELPKQGTPIPSSSQSRVKQFFVQQISCTPAAASRSSVTGSAIVPCPSSTQRPVKFRPKNISDLQQLQAELQNQAKRWKLSQCRNLSPMVAAAVHLVTDAAAQAARQQIIEKNSPAYTVLLDEGYRAGVMAQGCAALKAALGVRVITHVQLARVLVIVQKTIGVYMAAGDPASSPLAGCQYAWQQLKAFYSRDSSSSSGGGGGSSSDSPAWDLPPVDVCTLLFTFNQVTSTCLDPELVPCTVEYVLVPVPATLQQQLSCAFEGSVVGSFMMTGEGPAAQLAPFLGALPSSSSSNGSASGSSRGGTSSKAGTPFNSKAAISGPTAKAASHNSGSSGSSTGVQAASSSAAAAAAAATTSAKASSSSSSSNFASGKVVRVGCVPVGYANSMADPLDDCSLLTSFCSGFTFVLMETADWVAGGMADASRLHAAIKHFLLDRLSDAGHAAGCNAASAKSKASSSTSSRNGGAGAASSGTVRRSIVPRQLPGLLGTLPEMEQFLSLLVAQLWPDATAAAAVPALVVSAAKEVAREQVIERKSAASNALHANLYSAAVVAAGMAVLQQKVQITITTAAQLREVLIACGEALVSIQFESEHTVPSVRREAAHGLYRTLQLIAASSTGTGGTTVSRKTPPCSLDVAYQVFHGIMTSTVHMLECSGEMTQAKVDAFYSHLSATLLNSTPTQLFDQLASTGCPSAAASGAAASQDSTWGKGHALAGLKGFFQKPVADKPVTVKASSKGAVVASTAKQAAFAAAPGKPAQKAAAATARSSGAGGAAGSGKGSSAATPPELLVGSNLLKWYCSPEGLEHKVVVPLPQDSLVLLRKLQLSTLNRYGWNALHFACAAHRYELAKQLLQAGAWPVSEPESRLGLQPLHLACLGKLRDAAQFNKLVAAAGAVGAFEKYVRQHGGPACGALVELLVNSGADVDAKVVSEGVDLNGLRALHILARWSNDADEDCKAKIFQNPFVGKAVSMSAGDHVKVMAFNAARLDLIAAAKGELSLRAASGVLDEQGLDDDLSKWPAHVYAYCQQECGWDEEVDSCIQHLRVARMLLGLRADPNAEGPGLESPLFFAVRAANAAYADLLLRAGANPEQQRLDGARPLDIAGHDGQARVGWTLLCHGAQAVPMWELEGARSSLPHVRPTTHSMMPRMLVCNAVQCEDPPWNVRFLERLLADWAPVDEVWEETGETALQMAIGYQDPDMVRILVMAGANVGIHPNTKEQGPAASQVLYKGAGTYELEMLQTLLDAGADIHEWVDPNTDYDLLQSAANHGDVEAVIKLVEAGANWKLPVGQRVVGGSIFYVPEILTVHVPHLKLSYIEGRMKLAEKAGRQRRAAIATALDPWLPADINPECKEATLKTLVAASVVPGRPSLHRRPRVSSVRPVAGSSWRQSARAPAANSSIATVEEEEDKEEPGQQEVDDIDALLAELESDEDKGASSSKAGGKKKKKKETAAQREAKKQQKLRAMRLQQQQQQQQQQRGSSSDSEAEEVADSNSREGPAAAADEQQALDAEADTQQGAAAEAASEQAEQADKQLRDHQQQQQQMEPEQPHKQQKKSKKAKAAQQQQQQQQQHLHSRLSSARAETGAAEQQAAEPAQQLDHSTPGRPAQQQEQEQQQQQPLPPSQQQPAPLQREQQQKQQQQQQQQQQMDTPQSQVAKAAAGGSGVVVHAQQVGPLPAAAPVAAAAAAAGSSSSSGAAAGGSPVQVPAARAFLPPHLRMSMPGAASSTPPAPPAVAAVAAAGATPIAATVQQPHMQQQQAAQQVTSPTEHAAAGMRQRMVELAKQHQLQQQQQQQTPSPPPPLVSPRQQQQQQQQQPAKGAGPPLPALPHAMMALLSGSQQAAGAGPAQPGTSTTTAAGPGNAAVAVQHSRPVGAKRQAPAAATPTPGRAQQVPTPTAAAAGGGGTERAGPRDKPAASQRPTSAPVGGAAVAGAAGSADAAGAKGPKLCVVCSERRRNVLLIPCNHLVLCEQCAGRLDGQGGLSSCPLCSKPCKQRIRVHQS